MLGLRRDAWPYVGRVCALSVGSEQPICFSDSPPQLSELVWVNDDLYWSSKRAVLKSYTLQDVSTYQVVSEWHAPSKLRSLNGVAIWLNELTGSLWRIDDEG